MKLDSQRPVALAAFSFAALAACIISGFSCASGAGEAPGLVLETVPPTKDPLVEVSRTDPRIRVRAVYATPDNFVGEALYPVGRIYLRRSAMERLSRVQDDLSVDGLGLLVFDGYRP